MFLYVVASTLLSALAIQLRLPSSPGFVDNVIMPILIWVISLMSLTIFTFFSAYGTFGSILSIILIWKVVYNWLFFIGEKSANIKLLTALSEFDDIFNSPLTAVENLLNTITGLFSTAKESIKTVWYTITGTYTNVETTIKNTWLELETRATELVNSVTQTVKTLINQIITVLENILSLGGTLGDDEIPPLPEKIKLADQLNQMDF